MSLFDKKKTLRSVSVSENSNSEPEQEEITSASTAIKDEAIKSVTQAVFPIISSAVDAVAGNLKSKGYEFVNEGILFSLLIEASGIAKMEHIDLRTLAVALGQAWKLADLNGNGTTTSDTSDPENH